MADTRKDTRAPISLKVRFKSATVDEFIEHYCKDVSRGGIYIKSSQPLPVGTLLKFQFQLKDESALIRGVGRVVWTRAEVDAAADQPAGMGIKFIKMDNESRATVERIIESHESIGGTYESGRFNATSAEPFGSEPSIENGGESFFPSLPPAELPAPEDRTEVRQATQLLAAVLAEGGTDQAATREAERRAEEARKRTEEIEAQRRQELEQRRAAEREQQSLLPSMIVDSALSPRAPRPSRDELPGDRTPLPRPSQAIIAAARAQNEAEGDEPDTEPPPPQPPTTTTPTVTTSIPDHSNGKRRGFFPAAVIASLLLIALVVAVRGAPRELSVSPASEPVRDESVSLPAARPAAAPAEAPKPSTAEEPAAAPPAVAEPAEEPAPTPAEPAAAGLVPVDVVTAPPGAEVYVGTELRGRSPLTLELAEGTPVIVRARAPGHAELSQQVTPRAKNEALKLRLLPLQYLIEVNTAPQGAAVNVAGRRATTPTEIRLPEPPTAELAISVRLGGFAVARARVVPSQFEERDGAMRAVVNIKLASAGAAREAPPPAQRGARRAGEAAPRDAPEDEPAPAASKPATEAKPEPKAEQERPVQPAPAPKEQIPDNPFGE